MPAPSTRMCHICGRQFGKNSIDIHIPQCLKKYEAAQAQLPPHERKPAPAAPQLLGAGASDRAYNDAAYEALEANMAECEFCGRTFAPDRLAIHNRSRDWRCICKWVVATRQQHGWAQPYAAAAVKSKLKRRIGCLMEQCV